mgnify:CR=1 FL=1
MNGVGLIGAIVIGILAGWIAEKVMGRSHGLLTNLIVGLVGALLGAFIAGALHIGFGGFVGRNWQYDDLVFSLEANYNYFDSLHTSTTGYNSLDIVNPPGIVNLPNSTTTYRVTLTGNSAVQLKDAIQFRARAGWAVGSFLPYVFGGAVVGRMAVSRSVTSNVQERVDTTDPLTGVTTFGTFLPIPSQSQTLSEQKTNALVAGWAGGLGIETCLWGGLFLRGEWEYAKFLAVKNTVVSANHLRFGVGYKF